MLLCIVIGIHGMRKEKRHVIQRECGNLFHGIKGFGIGNWMIPIASSLVWNPCTCCCGKSGAATPTRNVQDLVDTLVQMTVYSKRQFSLVKRHWLPNPTTNLAVLEHVVNPLHR